MTWCQKWRICLQTDLIISEGWMPGFITVTKCLLFNPIIHQLSASLRQANLTSTCMGDYAELPPSSCFTKCLLSGCFWSLHVRLSTWKLHHALPFVTNPAAVFYLFPFFQLAGLCRYRLFTQVDRNRASANRYHKKKRVSNPSPVAHFNVKSHYFLKTKSKEVCYFDWFTTFPG